MSINQGIQLEGQDSIYHGNKKRKTARQEKANAQVSPPQSSSDEESWLIWQQLQEKKSALEAERLASQA